MTHTPAEQTNFPDPLIGEFRDHGERLVLAAPFSYIDSSLTITVPKGFVTDFHSVPRFLWAWMPPHHYPAAAVIHDWLYQNPGTMSRKDCDEVHLTILKLEGLRKSKRVAMYMGIRAGGWLPWKRYRDADAAAQYKADEKEVLELLKALKEKADSKKVPR